MPRRAASRSKLPDAATDDQERRTAPDGAMYTKRDFKRLFGGYSEWDQAKGSDDGDSAIAATTAVAAAAAPPQSRGRTAEREQFGSGVRGKSPIRLNLAATERFITAGLADDPVFGQKFQEVAKARREERREEHTERRRKLLEKTLRVALVTMRAVIRLRGPALKRRREQAALASDKGARTKAHRSTFASVALDATEPFQRHDPVVDGVATQIWKFVREERDEEDLLIETDEVEPKPEEKPPAPVLFTIGTFGPPVHTTRTKRQQRRREPGVADAAEAAVDGDDPPVDQELVQRLVGLMLAHEPPPLAPLRPVPALGRQPSDFAL